MLTRRQVIMAGAVLGLAGPGRAVPATGWLLLPAEPYRGKQDDISFVTPYLGWYGNGAGNLYRTRDGGETWEKVWDQPGTFIRALGFVDAQNGFLGNVGTEYYPNVTDTRPLYRTRDGGTTWTPIESPGIDIVKGICGIDVLHEKRIFQGEMREISVIHAAGLVGGPAAILRSIDGGDTWEVIDLREQADELVVVAHERQRAGSRHPVFHTPVLGECCEGVDDGLIRRCAFQTPHDRGTGRPVGAVSRGLLPEPRWFGTGRLEPDDAWIGRGPY